MSVPAEKSFEQWLAEANGGNVQAMLTVGIYYIFGEGVVEPNFESAEFWLKKAADCDNLDALLALGIAYDDAQLGHCNKAEAYKYFKRAADHGSIDAIFKVAQYLITGIGVPANVDEGLKMMRQAAELGNIDAQAALHQMHHHHGPDCDCGGN